MKIGLVRHFKVKHPFPNKLFVTKDDVLKWFDEYDAAEVHYKEVNLQGIHWQKCYSSPMLRAISTANHIHKGEAIQVHQLKELSILHLLPRSIKLPFIVWGILVRIKSLSASKETQEFKNNIAAFVDELVATKNTDTLIVSHWFVMQILQDELIKRGFTGDIFKSPDYGTIYVFSQ